MCSDPGHRLTRARVELRRTPPGWLRPPAGLLFVILLLSSSSPGARERAFCLDEGEHDCSDSILAVRFGSPDSRRSELEIPAEEGTEFTAWVTLHHPEPEMTSWSFGLAHDPAVLEIIAADLEGIDLPVPFLTYSAIAAGTPAPGAAFGYITEFFGEEPVFLPHGREVTVGRVRYRLLPEVESGQLTRLTFSEELRHFEDAFLTTINVSPVNRILRPFRLIEGEIRIGPCDPPCPTPPAFRRGETNGDDNIDISDALSNVGKLFLGLPSRVDCDAIHDVNGDGELDTSDPVTLLVWLFLGGKTPPPPFITCDSIEPRDLECLESPCTP